MLLTSILFSVIGCRGTAPGASATVLDSLDQGIGGPKAMGQPGDFLLENDHVRFVILSARDSLGPHTSGGSLVDADLNRHDARYDGGQGNDRFAEMFSTVNMNVQVADEGGGTVAILSDGSDGGDAVIRVEGGSEPFLTLLGGLWTVVGQPEFTLRTDYILGPDSPALLIRTTAVWGADAVPEGAGLASTSDEALPVLDLAIEDGAAFGDFYLEGGSADVFTPGVGFDEDGYVAALDAQGINPLNDPIVVDFLAGTADDVSYALMPATGRFSVPLFTSSQTAAFGAGVAGDGSGDRFPAGTAYAYERWFAVGQGDVGSALDALLVARGDATGRVSGNVLEEGTGSPISGAHVFVYKEGADKPWSEFQTDVGQDSTLDGSFSGTLPPGTYDLLAYKEGRPIGPRVTVDVVADQEVELALSSPQPGSVRFRVVDETGRMVPAKVSFFSDDGSVTRNPDLGDGRIEGGPVQVVFAPYGGATVVLPPGTYTAVASRGPEYDLDESAPFTLAADQSVALDDLQVIHSVDTEGWISADFHVHGVHSFDSGTSEVDRVGTMVSEGVEFLSSNDHDAVTDYAPTIESMGLTPWLSSAVGVEVTTLEIGHFLGFPLVYNSLSEQGGAFHWSQMTPGEIVDGIRAQGEPGGVEPVVFVGHPRDGILGYFDQFGLSQFEGKAANGVSGPQPVLNPSILVTLTNDLISAQNFSDDFDALELLNAKRFEMLRTATQTEVDLYGESPDNVDIYDMISRTMTEQQRLIDGDTTLTTAYEGPIDDWFNLLNLGYKYVALGNSDTHSKTSVESGCPRNYVFLDNDTPGQATPEDVAEAVRAGHVVASYGPFVRFEADDAAIPGDTVTGATHTLHIEVQTPGWFSVDRVELYESGTLIQEWTTGAEDEELVDLDTTVEVTPAEDAWYVVIALGQDDLNPLYTPVEIPPIQLQDVVTDALAGVPAVSSFLGPSTPFPRTFPVMPYALTNPIWVDIDGAGWTPPGLPDWLVAPAAE